MRPAPPPTWLGWAAGWLVVLLGIGCGAAVDPLDRPIQADSLASYHHWLRRAGSALDASTQQELQAAIQQLKLRRQIDQAGQSPDAITREVYRQIDGLTPREVITQGHLWNWRRLAQENAMDDRLFELNAAYPLTPDAADSIVARFTEQLHDIRLRQAQRRLEMTYLERRMHALHPESDLLQHLRTNEGAPASDPPLPPSPDV